MLFYLLPAALVFGLLLQNWQQDPSTPMTDGESWGFILLASLLWPITLPSILYKKYQKTASQVSESVDTTSIVQ